jgi:membrane-associated phospholipid phosphatase
MFLNKNNTIKWKWVAVAAAVTTLLCIAGVVWLDKPLYEFLRQFNWQIWTIFDELFATKVWLFVTFVGAVFIFIINRVKTKSKNKKSVFRFNIAEVIRDFMQKSKNNVLFLMFCSIALGSVAGAVLKYGLGRARPIFFEALSHTGFYPFNTEWAFHSMPSGHSISSFAALVTLGLLFPKFKWATWTSAILIGFSRICYGAHWPSDVLLGAFIGMLSADLIISYFKKQ